MRIKAISDIAGLGDSAKRQIIAAMKERGGITQQKRASSINEYGNKCKQLPAAQSNIETIATTQPGKKTKPSRVMRTDEGLTYCPWPSTDPFVAVVQRLEAKYGRYEDGGMLVTELILDGGTKDWRFDIALISPLQRIDILGRQMNIGHTCLVEADGFGFHRSKDAFKNDRAKQTHALKQGFVVKRLTNDDARNRLDEVIEDIAQILSQPRIYESPYEIREKGLTQSILYWKNV